MPGIRTHTVRCLERRCSAAAAGRGASAMQHACQIFRGRHRVFEIALPVRPSIGPRRRSNRSEAHQRDPGPGCFPRLLRRACTDRRDAAGPTPPGMRWRGALCANETLRAVTTVRQRIRPKKTRSRPTAALASIRATLPRNRAIRETARLSGAPSTARNDGTDDPTLLGHPELATGAAALALGLGPRRPGPGRLGDLGRLRRRGPAGLRARSDNQGRNQNCSAHQNTRVHNQDPSPDENAGGWHQPEVADRRKAGAARNRIRPARSCIRVNGGVGG